jgi:hypothetical protein
MAKPKDKGQAFPFSDGAHYETGMALRDYFAAKAMQAIITKRPHEVVQAGDGPDEDNFNVARGAYDYADAMLKVRGEVANGK